MEKSYESGIMKKTIKISSSKEEVWKFLCNIVGLERWVYGVKKTIYLSDKKRGVGAIRRIFFNDGNQVEEQVVGWKNGEYFSYIATSGLPLRAYHATISIEEVKKDSIKVTWQSFFNTQKMSKKEFSEFTNFIGSFYQESLSNLKKVLEKD